MDGELMGSARSTLRTNFQNQYSETGVEWTTAAEINIWIQEAHDLIGERAPYYTLTATTPLVANQYRYADSDSTNNFYPLRVESVERLDDSGTTYYGLLWMPHWQYLKRMGSKFTTTNPLSTGTPSHWTWHGGYIYLYPCPSYAEAAGLRVTAVARDILDEDTDTTHLPAQYERLVIFYCLYKAYTKDDQIEKGRYYLGEFETGVGQLRAWLQSGTRVSTPTRLPTADERRVRLG